LPGEIFPETVAAQGNCFWTVPDPPIRVPDVITLFTAMFWIIFTFGQATKSDNLDSPFF
jgi:hypothetical protein